MASRGDPLSCSICLESFTNPKLLQCFHTFCLECIRQYIATTQQGEYFFCPVCRSKTKIPQGGPDKFQTNFYITRTKDDHGRKCEQHSDENIRFYCELCKKFICRDCKLSDHEGHKTRNISDVLKEEKSKLLIMASDVKKKVAKVKALEERKRKSLQQVFSSCNSAKTRVKETTLRHLESLENKINGFLRAETEKITSQLDNIDKQVRNGQTLSAEIDKALESNDIVEIQSQRTRIGKEVSSFSISGDKDMESFHLLGVRSVFRIPTLCQRGIFDVQLMKIRNLHLNSKEIRTALSIRYICPFQDKAYAVGHNGDITLMSIDGSIICMLDTKGIPGNIVGAAYGRKSKLLFLNTSNGKVYTLSPNGSIKMFPYYPLSFNERSSFNICKGEQLSPEGMCNEDHLIFYTMHSSEFPTLHVLCVKSGMMHNRIPTTAMSCFPSVAKFGTLCCLGDEFNVFLIDSNGNMICEYEQPKDPRLEATLKVGSICFDSRENIYVADINNHAIHVLDNHGFFIKLLLTKEDGIRNIEAVEVDESDRLWVAHSKNEVLIGQLCYDK